MSQDMMQALSGSSLLSLSIGTLPAVKPGMNLDANPFASQLALMTGTDASVAGMLAPVAMATVPGEGGFAATLADLAGPAEPAPMALSTGEAAAPGMARTVAAPEAPIVAALPEEANTAQLIEAALTGAATIAEAPVAPEGSRAPEAPRAPEAAPVLQTQRPAPQAPLAATTTPSPSTAALPIAGDDAAPGATQGVAQPSLTVQPLLPASQVPHLKHLIRADAPMPIRAQLQPEAEPGVADTAGTASPAPQVPIARSDETPSREVQGENILPATIAPALTQAPAPRPEAPVTDLDTTGIAAEAAPEAPRQSAEPRSASASPERPAPRLPGAPRSSDAPQPVAAAPVQPAIAPMAEAAPVQASQPAPAAPVQMQPQMHPQMPPVSVAVDAAAAPVVPMAAAQDHTEAASPAPVATETAPAASHARKARVLRDPVVSAQSSAPEIPLAQPVIAPIAAAAQTPVPVTGDAAPATTPIAAAAAPQRMAAAPRQPSAPLSAPRATADAPIAPLAAPDAAARAPIAPGPIDAQPAAPVDARAATMPVAPAPAQPAAAPVRTEPMNVPQMARPDEPASAPLASSDSASAAPTQPLSASNAAPAQPVQTGAATVESRQQAPAQQASVQQVGAPQVIAPPVSAPATAASEAVRIAESVPAAMAAPVQAPAPRAQVSPAARRVIDAALQTPRTGDPRNGDPRTAQFDRAELSVPSGTTSLAAEPVATSSTEAVPPAWAAALNAVNPQVQQASGTAAPQAAAHAAQAQVHNLAFDAGFVAGIESQIAKLVDGGQMVKIQVMPEHLGRIDIEMLAGPERDQVRIVTEHDAVRDTLVSSQHRLEQDLRSQGQRNIEVTVELRQQSPGTQNGSAQQQQQRGQSGAESASAREAAQRGANAETQTDTNPAPRRPRGNVRYA